ncbi:MAG TPA: hypothetical protein VLV82_04230, partial [Candidatus Angelobacter sp.]|nr:hypothetical protein [Candidatus Angelobacter sp.]
MPGARRERPASTRVGAPAYDRLEGRLDLDALDAPVDLDVVAGGADAPLLAERVAEVLERLGVTPFVRRHRRSVSVVVVAAAGVLVGLGAWWTSRPEPLPPTPHVLVTASGSDRSQIGLSPAAGGLVRVRLDVAVVSSERAGVAVTLLGLTGPALEPPPDG